MNLAFTYESAVPAKGGCETYLADLLRRLAQDGHELHIYSVDLDRSVLPSGLVHHPIPAPTGPRFLRPWRFAAACEAALRNQHHDLVVGLNKTWQQDVLIPQGGLHSASARFNLRKSASPLGRGLGWLLQRLTPAYWSFRALERRQYSTVRPFVVVPSRFVLGHLVSEYGYDHEQVRVNPNAIDVERFVACDRPLRRQGLREEVGFHPNDVVGLFSGHNYRLKGLAPLLHAFARVNVPHCKLLVCGSPKVGAYRRLARRLRIADRVRFLGFVDDIRDSYFAADFLVHPTFYDPCALVTLEALACALPVITTTANGASELLPPALARHVIDDPHDTTELARHIEALCDHDHRLALARQARLAAANWTFEHHYQNLLEIFQEVARRKQAA